MENSSISRQSQIDVLFRTYSDRILNYIRTRINNLEEAENLAQDVWIRIIESDAVLCLETAVAYLFRIASNLVNDYLRSLYTRMGHHDEVVRLHSDISDLNPEEDLYVKQVKEYETKRIECLPPQRRTIYIMSRFEDKSVNDIAEVLSLSFRTVENHLRMGRRDIRDYISAIA